MNRALISTLNKQFEPYDGLAVAVSGGVDSSLLLAAACEYYCADNCLAVIAVSPSLGACELEDARSLCQQLDVELVELQSNEIENLAYVANDGTRCYWCKQELFKLAIPVAAFGFLSPIIATATMGLSDIVVIGNSILLKVKK